MMRLISIIIALLCLLLLPCARADNQASFDALGLGHYKQLKNQTQEDFLNKYGTPDKTLTNQKNGKTVETYSYTYSNCRYRFSFDNHVFSHAERTCF